MAGAARVHIAERGRDPRRYALVCTGGGGPVHGYGVARKLGDMTAAGLPAIAGGGLGLGPAGRAGARRPGDDDSVFASTAIDFDGFEAAFRQLEEEARDVVAATGLPLAGCASTGSATAAVSARASILSCRCRPAPTADDGHRPTRAGRRVRARGVLSREIRPRPAGRARWSSSTCACRCAVAVPGGQIAELAAATVRRREVGDQRPAPGLFAETGGVVDAPSTTATASVADRRSGPRADRRPGLDAGHRPAPREVMPSGSICRESLGDDPCTVERRCDA